MRVERFSLFFPPLIARVRRGETEYAIGAIPLGGYVKITGMNPNEEIPPEVADRAYYRQPVWKRIVVIAAGPVHEHPDRVRDHLGAPRSRSGRSATRSSSTRRQGHAGRRAAAARATGSSRSTAAPGTRRA